MDTRVYLFFNQYSEPIRSILIFFLTFNITSNPILNTIKLVLSSIAFIVNLFHTLVLSRKEMRSSSVNVLMIGLALSDMIYFSIEVTDIISNYFPKHTCTPPKSYSWIVFLSAKTVLYNIARRFSPWIGVIMAFTRLLVSSYPFNITIGKMVNPRFAVWTLSVIALLSILIESDYYVLQEIQGDVQWVPEGSCGFPKNYSQPVYVVQYYRWLIDDVQKYYVYTKTIFKYLPAVVLPLLTIGLVIVLRNIRKSRQKLQVSSEDSTYQTTRLVTIMTFCMVITEVSTGIFTLTAILTSAMAKMTAFSLIAGVLNEFFSLFYSLNSMAHCCITWLLSSQYRSCAKSLFPCFKLFEKKSKTVTTQKVISLVGMKFSGTVSDEFSTHEQQKRIGTRGDIVL
ncbi:hypothetical protein CAEBREN_16256 [Caenorhabditis brenneri]|uniref:G-protein coupled receptors family 1 profile domain-containing protein n=1 Tax=Caenorhabditis brenneri TaxID=135651 RepID=G0M9F0_CAEBE|nr:hypothetical protein CAEBREN_16256 [Caenorhabditis brenneri]